MVKSKAPEMLRPYCLKTQDHIQQNIINSGIKKKHNTKTPRQRQDLILLVVLFNLSIILLDKLNLWNINLINAKCSYPRFL